MKLKYTHLLLAIFIIMLYSTTAMATQNNHIVMRFAVGSDLHKSEGPWGTSWENDLNNFTNWSNNEHNSSLGLNYTFFNGDIFEANNIFDAYKTMKTLQDNYFSKLLNPYHYVIGNNEGLSNSTFYRALNYSTDWLITDGNFTFVFLNISKDYNISNTTYLNSTLNTYANKTVFVFIHVPQIGYVDHDAYNKTFIDIINSHPNVVAVINGHDHNINACYHTYQNNTSIYNTSIYNCWDGCLNSGDINYGTFSGARIFEVYDDGQVLTYEYSLTTNQIVNRNVIYPLDTNKNNETLEGSFPAGKLITISRDGDCYATVQRNPLDTSKVE